MSSHFQTPNLSSVYTALPPHYNITAKLISLHSTSPHYNITAKLIHKYKTCTQDMSTGVVTILGTLKLTAIVF